MKQIRSEVTTTGKNTVDKPAAATKTKAADTKKPEPAQGDTMKADKAKEKVAEKSKADDKSKTEKK